MPISRDQMNMEGFSKEGLKNSPLHCLFTFYNKTTTGLGNQKCQPLHTHQNDPQLNWARENIEIHTGSLMVKLHDLFSHKSGWSSPHYGGSYTQEVRPCLASVRTKSIRRCIYSLMPHTDLLLNPVFFFCF